MVTFNKIGSSFANEIETTIQVEVVYRVFKVEEILVFDDHLDDFRQILKSSNEKCKQCPFNKLPGMF